MVAAAAGMGADADAVSMGRAGLASRRMARMRAVDDIVWINCGYSDLFGMQGLMRACVA